MKLSRHSIPALPPLSSTRATVTTHNATLGIYEQRLQQLELENNHITNLPECDRSVHKYSQRIYEHTEGSVRCY
jgi:hypothetical protein